MTVLLEYLDFSCNKLQLLNFYKNSAPFMLEDNLQPVVTSFISIALIMMIVMMTIGMSRF